MNVSQGINRLLVSGKKQFSEAGRPDFSPGEILFMGLVLVYLAIASWAAYRHGILDRINFFLYVWASITGLVLFAKAFLVYSCARILWWKATIKPRPRFSDWWPWITKDLLLVKRLVKSIPMFISLALFLSMITNMKGLISYYGDYIWDPLLADWDRKLHFGMDPWRILQPVLGYPIVTVFINYIYNLWHVIFVSFLYWQLFSLKSPRLRLQFFYTLFFCWALNGSLLAILFASGGPCFYEFMTGSDYYSELMTYLREVDRDYGVFAIGTQDMLLDFYRKDTIMIGAGISAMPSLHLAMAALFYLLTSQINKWLGRFFAIFCFFIMLGSVHLGWHYAIDGYVSIVLTWVYWKLSGAIVERVERVEAAFPRLKGVGAR